MFNLHNFREEQHEHCNDLLREAEQNRLAQEALANRQEGGRLPQLFLKGRLLAVLNKRGNETIR